MSAPEDIALVRQLLPLWFASRTWAEELLVRSFDLDAAADILLPEHRGRKRIPGTNWFYRTHGVGVDIDRGLDCGGIDFDFDKPPPDPWRLRRFAEKQLNSGILSSADYFDLVDDQERFEAAAELALA